MYCGLGLFVAYVVVAVTLVKMDSNCRMPSALSIVAVGALVPFIGVLIDVPRVRGWVWRALGATSVARPVWVPHAAHDEPPPPRRVRTSRFMAVVWPALRRRAPRWLGFLASGVALWLLGYVVLRASGSIVRDPPVPLGFGGYSGDPFRSPGMHAFVHPASGGWLDSPVTYPLAHGVYGACMDVEEWWINR